MRNRPALGRRGFALPVTVFIVTLLTIMLATGFARVRADSQIAVSSEYTVDALAIAQSGLQAYFATQPSRPADGDSVRINVPGGYAWVVSRVLQRPADTLQRQSYIVRSTGYVIEPTISGEPQAQRTVAQFAAWQVGYIDPYAALTGLTGVQRWGQGGWSQASDADTMSGVDACGAQLPTRSVWTTSYSQPSNPNFPPVIFEPVPYDQSAGATDIDWDAATGTGITPDYTSIQVGSTEWAIQRVEGDATLSDGSGTGLLIVTGSLYFGGGFAGWEGIILVGRALRLEASLNRIEGLVVTGLSGGGPPTRFGGAGRQTVIRYNSCHVLQALQPLTGFAQIPNAWIDNWATY